MLYHKNDIIAMAMVYEGHLPQGHTLNKRELATEVIDRAHQAGLPAEISLSPHTAIRAQRADEASYWAGSYEPADDLPVMLQDCIAEVRGAMIANGETPGPMSVKTLQFKGWSSVTSTVWVAIQVKH